MYDGDNKELFKMRRCFTAMWLGSSSDVNCQSEMNRLFDEVISPAVKEHNLEPYRVDRDPAADKIDEAIMDNIDNAKLMVVDLTHNPTTGVNGNVMFEAGYGICAKKTVIWMCREDLIDKIPFDVQQFKQIRWNPKKLKDARLELSRAIEAKTKVLGQARNIEAKRLISNMWNKLKGAEDIPPPPGSQQPIKADQVRFVMFKEFCGDLKTRAKYKDMGLTPQERYELIEIVRGFENRIKFLERNDRIANMDIYENWFAIRLRADGWLD